MEKVGRFRKDRGELREFLWQYVEKNKSWSRLFSTIVNHEDGGDTIIIKPRSFNVFCENAISVNVVETIHLDQCTNINFCKDFCASITESLNSPVPVGGGLQNAYKFRALRGYTYVLLGYYLIELESFVTCDFSHTPFNVKINTLIRTMIKEVKNRGHLKTYVKKEPSKPEPEPEPIKIKNFSITLGADPEFELLDCGNELYDEETDPFYWE